MGKMIVLDSSGHSEMDWDPMSPSEVGRARQEFFFLKAQWYYPFAHRRGGGASVRLDEFDPDAEEITWLRPLRGG